MPAAPLPDGFRAALGEAEQVLVSSRSAGRELTVPMSFALSRSGGLFLMTSAFSRKVRRWERDPWVRVGVAGTALSLEGTVSTVDPGELDPDEAGAVLERFITSGAATPEALRELLGVGTHLLLRVDPAWS